MNVCSRPEDRTEPNLCECARCAEGNADYSTLIAPGHVLTCVPNTNHQVFVGAFARAVLEAWEGK